MTTRPVNLNSVVLQVPGNSRSLKHVRLHSADEEKVSRCADALFATMLPHASSFHQQAKPPLRAGLKKVDDPGFVNAGAGHDVVTDVSFFIRALPAPVGNAALDALMGNSTGINSFLGYACYLKAAKVAQACKAVGWSDGEISAKLNQTRSVIQCVGGGIFFGVRALSLASLLKGVDASGPSVPTLLGRVTFVVSTIGSVLWGIFYSLLAIMCMKDMSNISKLYKEWESVKINPENPREMNDPQRLARYVAFMEKYSGLKGALEAEVQNENTDDELEAAALNYCAEVLKSLFEEGELPEVTEEGRKALVKDILRATHEVRSEDDLKELLVGMGREWKTAQLQAKRKLQLGALAGGACVPGFAQLAERLEGTTRTLLGLFDHERQELNDSTFSEMVSKGDLQAVAQAQRLVRETQPLVQTMEKGLSTNWWLNFGYCVACVIGTLATLAGLLATFTAIAFFAAPAMAIAITVAFLVVVTMMIVLDGYCLNETLKSATPGSFDKTLLTISTVIGALAILATLILVNVLSLGLVSLIAAIVIAVVWMGVNGKVWSTLVHNERKVAPISAPDEAAAVARHDAEEREKLDRRLGQLALDHFVRQAYFPSSGMATA